MPRIESYNIPIIEKANQGTICGELSEFFQGYFYYGEKRYVVEKIGDKIKYLEKREDHTWSTVLKIASLPILWIIGVGFLIKNIYDRKTHDYQEVPWSRLHNERAALQPVNRNNQQAFVPPRIPDEPGYGFVAFRRFAYNRLDQVNKDTILFGDYTKQQWEAIVKGYRTYLNDDPRFIREMLFFKKELLAWSKGIAEPDLEISKTNFIETTFPELFLTNTIENVLTEEFKQAISQRTDFEETLVSLFRNRLIYSLDKNFVSHEDAASRLIQLRLWIEGIKAQYKIFADMGLEKQCLEVTYSLIDSMDGEKLGYIANINKQFGLEHYKKFIIHILQKDIQGDRRADMLKAVFRGFWEVWKQTLPSELPNYSPTLWSHVLPKISNSDLEVIMKDTLPDTISDGDLQTITNNACLGIRHVEEAGRSITIPSIKETLRKCPKVARFVKN